MLPGLSGTEVLRQIRRADHRVPILMLTARDAVSDKVYNEVHSSCDIKFGVSIRRRKLSQTV